MLAHMRFHSKYFILLNLNKMRGDETSHLALGDWLGDELGDLANSDSLTLLEQTISMHEQINRSEEAAWEMKMDIPDL
jgi:hypothetical protein